MNRYRIKIPDESSLQLHRNVRPELYDQHIVEKLRESLPLEFLSRYPDVGSFQNKLSIFLGVKADNVAITSGVDGAIRAVFETWSPDRVAILSPTYKMYEIYAEVFGTSLSRIESKPDLSISIDEVLCVLPKVNIVFLPNPHEPVENIFTRKQITEIAKEAKKYNTLLVVDEAYFLFGAPTAIDLAPYTDNLIVMRSFSKGFGLPSIRLGYIIGNHIAISHIQDRRLAYETNSLSMWIAEWAVDNRELFEEYLKEVIENREFLKNNLNRKGFETHGSCSNTILVNLIDRDRALAVTNALETAGVLVRGFPDFPNVATWVSVTVGRKSTTTKFLDTFYSIVDRI